MKEQDVEAKCKDISLCREIVSEIMNLNPSQGQIMLIMQLLALELTDHQKTMAINDVLKEFINEHNVLLLPVEE